MRIRGHLFIHGVIIFYATVFLPTRAFLILNHISTSQEKARNIRQKLFVQKSKCIILITKILKQYETITNLNGAIIIKLLDLAKAKLSMSTYIGTIPNITKQSSSTFTIHRSG